MYVSPASALILKAQAGTRGDLLDGAWSKILPDDQTQLLELNTLHW